MSGTVDQLFFFLGDINHVKLGGGDSFSDQLNCKYTVFILSLFAFVVTAKFYFSEPISCFCPANFPSSQIEYTDRYCWATNTHYEPFEKPNLPLERESKVYISYYQWVPLFFAGQAILFYLPRPLWKALSRKAGVSVSNITDSAIECHRKNDVDAAEKTMQYMTSYLARFLKDVRRRRDAAHWFPPLSIITRFYYSHYLTMVFLFIKLLYVINVVGQLFIINAFLGTNYHLYGFDVMRRMAEGKDWTTSTSFPRVTMCDFKIWVVGNIHRHTVQCTLPMNLYNEMMFIFLWFWFVLVGIVTITSFVYWTANAATTSQQINYVRPRLAATGRIGGGPSSLTASWSNTKDQGNSRDGRNWRNSDSSGDRRGRSGLPPPPPPLPPNIASTELGDVRQSWPPNETVGNTQGKRGTGDRADIARFVDMYLTRDGCLIVRLVAENSSDVIAADLLSRLYDLYKNPPPTLRKPPTGNCSMTSPQLTLSPCETNIDDDSPPEKNYWSTPPTVPDSVANTPMTSQRRKMSPSRLNADDKDQTL